MAETTKKKNVSANAATPKKQDSKKKSGTNDHLPEIITIITAAVGILLIYSLWFKPDGIVSTGINCFFTGIFGCGAYLFPFALLGGAVCHFVFKDETKYIYISVFFLILCSLLHYMHIIDTADYIYFNVSDLWKTGVGSIGGGVIGGIIAEVFLKLFGAVPTFVMFIAFLLVDIILLFKISVLSLLGRFFGFLGKSIKDCFTAVRDSDDEQNEPSVKKIRKGKKESERDEFEFPDKISSDFEDEISIKNPLDDIFIHPEKPTVAAEQLPLAEAEPTSDDIDENAPAHDSENAVDNTIASSIEESLVQPVREYVFPGSDLLDVPAPVTKGEKMEQLRENAARLLEILQSFGIEAKITNVTRGSSVTRYEVVPAAGVKVSKITSLDQDIAMRLPAENVRIEVLPGSVGIEASNGKSTAVYIRDMIESPEFASHPSKVAAVLGRDIDGKVVVVDIAKMPHLLIAGATGSGKSVCINTIITSILYKATPEEVRLVMVDPKVVELEMYNGIPHLLVPIVTDPRKAAGALCWAVNEMEERYKKFAENSVRNISGYNKKIEGTDQAKMPQIVIIIDELADLMMVAPGEVQDYICRLAQKARAAGMHLILATQRPSVDVITGLIKANIPSRFSFKVASAIDSRTILDCGGAEKLMGKGDMLMMIAGNNKLVRLQGAWVSDGDVERVTSFIKSNCDANYSSDVEKSIEGNTVGNKKDVPESNDETDELFDEAVDIAFELDQISTSMLQRRLKIGYARAGRLIDLMDKMGVISTYDGSNKPRTLRMTREQFYAMRSGSSESEPEAADDNDAPF